MINHRIVAPTTETDAERAWRYGLERTNQRDQGYGYVMFKDDSMMTNVGVYSKRREAFRHADALLKKRRGSGISD